MGGLDIEVKVVGGGGGGLGGGGGGVKGIGVREEVRGKREIR